MYTEEQIESMLTSPERFIMYKLWKELERFNSNLEALLPSQAPKTRKSKEE